MSPPLPAPGARPPVVVEVVVHFGDRIVDVRHVAAGRYVIGEGPDAHLTVALPPEVDRAGVPLVHALVDQAVLGLVPGMTGELEQDGRVSLLAELLAAGRRSTALARGDRCEARLGALRFTITTVEPALLGHARRPVDRLYWLSNAASLLVLGGLLLLGDPGQPGELDPDTLADSRARAIRYLTDLPPPPEPERPPPPPPQAPVQKTRSPAAAPASADAPPPPSAPAELLEQPADPAAAPTAPKTTRRGISNRSDHARGAGLLGDGEFMEGVDRVAAIGQQGLLAYADDAADRAFWGAVAAAPPRDPRFGGMDLAETERGGGRHGDKKVSSTAIGQRAAAAAPAGPPPTADEIAKARRIVTIRYEAPGVQGGLDPLDVQSQLRKQDGALRSCYKDATGTDNREGHVVLRLKLNATGRVIAATLEHGSKGVDGIGPCLTAAAERWKFEAPWDRQPATVIIEAALTSKSM